MQIRYACLSALLVMLLTESMMARTWTTRGGDSYEATFVERNDCEVVLEDAAGESVTLRLIQLSTEDRAHVATLSRVELPEFALDDLDTALLLLETFTDKELLNTKRGEAVYVAMLLRSGLEGADREEAITALAKLTETSHTAQLVAAMERAETSELEKAEIEQVVRNLVVMLMATDVAALKVDRAAMVSLLETASLATTRRNLMAALMFADGSVDEVWQLATKTEAGKAEVIGCLPMLADAETRRQLYAKFAAALAQPEAPERRAAIEAAAFVPGKEAEVFRALAQVAAEDDFRADAVRAMLAIPKVTWPKEAIAPLANQLAGVLRAISADKRGDAEVAAMVRLAGELALLMPLTEAAPIIEVVSRLRVVEYTIRTVPHQMKFDRERIAVAAGKSVKIVFTNTDIMPHNIVFSTPGSRIAVGQAADTLATQPDAKQRHFVPDVPEVLHASRLLDTSQTQTIDFVAPAEPGEYDFVCTFPGHWQRMYGTMVVVEDLDGYLRENPLPPPTDVGHARQIVKSWSFDDFKNALDRADCDRDFERGKELFQITACASCHQMQKKGGAIGPDLTEVFERHKGERSAVLREMVEPSALISDKYKQTIVLDLDGKQHAGIILKETDEYLLLASSPLADCKPTKIEKDPEEPLLRKTSEVSIMPGGLLNTLSEEEVLDLLAYLESGGDSAHPIWGE